MDDKGIKVLGKIVGIIIGVLFMLAWFLHLSDAPKQLVIAAFLGSCMMLFVRVATLLLIKLFKDD